MTGLDLKNWRKQNNLTQEELAKKTDYSISRIAHVEKSAKEISKKLEKKINELDKVLNPPIGKNTISEKLSSMKSSISNFQRELTIVEEQIVSLLSLDTESNEVREAYLKFFGKTLMEIKSIADISCSDESLLREDVNQHLRKISKEARIYLYKKNKIKE